MAQLITSLVETGNGKSLAIFSGTDGDWLYLIDSANDTATKTNVHGFEMRFEQKSKTFTSRIGYMISFQDESRVIRRIIVDGRGVLSSVYGEIVDFEGGNSYGLQMIRGRETGKYALLDDNGEILCPFLYDSFTLRDVSMGTLVIYGVDGGRDEAIKTFGKMSVEQYSMRKREAPIHGFRKILADYDYPELQNGGWKQFLSPNGKYDPERILEMEVIDDIKWPRTSLVFANASLYEASNTHLVTYFSLKMGVVDDKGNVIFPAEYDEIIYNHTRKVFVAYRNDMTYLYDITGQNQLASIDGTTKVLFFDDSIVFYNQHKEKIDGVVRLWVDRGVVLDYSGKKLFEGDMYPYAHADSHLYVVRTNNYHGKDWRGSVCLMDGCFNMIIPAEYSDISGYIYSNTVEVTRFDGKTAIYRIEDGKAMSLTPFSANVNSVLSKEPLFCFKRGKKNIVVDYDGKTLFQSEEYEPKERFGNGYWGIEDVMTYRKGIAAPDGTNVLPCGNYDNIKYLGGSLFELTDKDNKSYLYVVGGNKPVGYDGLFQSSHGFVIAEKMDGSNRYSILIDQNGKEMEPFAKSRNIYVLSESRAVRILLGVDGKLYSEYVNIPTGDQVNLVIIGD